LLLTHGVRHDRYILKPKLETKLPQRDHVWNAHNTVFGSKHSAICVQAVYLLH